MDIDSLLNQPGLVTDYLLPWSVRLGSALLILLIGKWLAGRVQALATRLMKRSNVDPILTGFLGNILYGLLLIVVFIAALDRLGIQTTSLLAVLGAAGLAIGLALKDSLSNFSAGVMLIIFRPFKTGDFVEAGGVSGVIEHVRIFNTVMRTGDNREVIVPNSQVYGDVITNFSARDTRRIDLVIGISYDDNIARARDIINQTLAEEERVLPEPAPVILVMELADSSVNLAVRPWVRSSDYWPTRSSLLENIKRDLEAGGLSIPFPQRDVHLHQTDGN